MNNLKMKLENNLIYSNIKSKKKKNHIGINLTKEALDVHTENYKHC